MRGSTERYEEEDGWKRRVEFVFQYTTLGIIFSLFDDLITPSSGVWIWVRRTIKTGWLAYRWMGEGDPDTGGSSPASAMPEVKQTMQYEENADDIKRPTLTARRVVYQASQTDPVYIQSLVGPDFNDDHSRNLDLNTSRRGDLPASPQVLLVDKGPESSYIPGTETYESSSSLDDSGLESSSLSADSEGNWGAEQAGEAAELEERSAGPDAPQVACDQREHANKSVKKSEDGQSVKVDTASARVTGLEQDEGEVEHMSIIDETDKQSAVGSQSGPSLTLERSAPIDYRKILGDRDQMQRKSELPVKQPKEPFVPIMPTSILEETEGQSATSDTLHPMIIAPLAPLRLSRRRSNGKPESTIQRGSTRTAEGKEPAEEMTYKALQRFRSGLAELEPTFTFDRRRQINGEGRATTGHRRARTIDVRMSTTARLDELLGFEDKFGVKT